MLPLLALLLVPVLSARAQEVTDPAERQRFIDRVAGIYYDLRSLGFLRADCDVHSSMVDDLDTMIANNFPDRPSALKDLRGLTLALHLELVTAAKPMVTTAGKVSTGDEEADSMVTRMIAWSSGLLTNAVNTWRLFANGDLATPHSATDARYTIIRQGSGYRVVSQFGMELMLDSALRFVKYDTHHGNITISSTTHFRETPRGLVLDRVEASIPRLKTTNNITLEFAESDGVLLPSKVTVIFDRQQPGPDGIVPGKMTLTFLLSRYRIEKG